MDHPVALRYEVMGLFELASLFGGDTKNLPVLLTRIIFTASLGAFHWETS